MSRSYSYKRSTVVKTADGFLEVRRGDITWTKKFRAANPDVKQRIWATLTEWHASLSVGDTAVDVWKKEAVYRLTFSPADDADAVFYRLGDHLAYFMGCDYATEECLSAHVHDFSDFVSVAPEGEGGEDFLRFLLGRQAYYEAVSSGDILTALESQGHILGTLEVKPVVTDTEMAGALAALSRLSLGTPAATPAATPSLTAATPTPAPTGGAISFAGITFKEETPAPPCLPAFTQIHAVLSRVEDALADPHNKGRSFYKKMLLLQFLRYCMRPDLASAWRSNAFERIQMRATLATWSEFKKSAQDPEVKAAITLFLDTYPV